MDKDSIFKIIIKRKDEEMKFLLIFIDMLRPNLLNIYDNKNKENRIDRQLKMWGGYSIYGLLYAGARYTKK